jgi:hypothetical protein
MSLQFRKRFKENLKSIPVYIEDNSTTSDEYFGIKEFPTFFGRGKNAIRVKPNRFTLKPDSQIYIEILDINSEPIYYEIPDYSPGDLSRYISVWIYGQRNDLYNTPNGVGEIIICGIAQRTAVGEEIPDEFKDVINIRWRRRFSVSREVRSESPIVFKNSNSVPTIFVSESFSFYREIPTQGLNEAQTVSETINQNIIYTSDFGGANVFLETPNYQLNPNWVGGKIKINLQNVTLSPQLTSAEVSAGLLKPVNYTASLQSLITSRKVRVANPLTSSVTTKTESLFKTFTLFSTGSFVVETISTGSATLFSQSLAHITIRDVNPIVGNVDKINVYIRSRATGGTLTEYQLIGTKLLYEPITGSAMDIYSDSKTNLTQSTHTFIYTPTNKNIANDIKVEYLNSQNDFANYESVLSNYYFKGYDSQASGSGGGDITELSQSLSTEINNINSSITELSSSYTLTSSSLSSEITSLSSSLLVAISEVDVTNVVYDTGDGRFGLRLSDSWNGTTLPSASFLEAENKSSWTSGEVQILRNANRTGMPTVLADADGFLEMRLVSDGGVSVDKVIFLPYYSSSYT